MGRKIFKTGNSLAITLSKKILEDLGLKAGDRVETESDAFKHQIIIKPAGHREQLSLGIKVRPRLK